MTQAASTAHGQLRILIIDDDPAILRAISGTLRVSGFQTLTASSGEDGTREARLERPDLIVCDVTMPGMDGYDVLHELRKDPRTAVIPFIFVSGNRDEDYVRHGMGLGADDYLVKPFTPDQLIKSIEARIRRQRVITQKIEALRLNLAQSVPTEFFNPLNAILGFTTLMMDNLRMGGEINRAEFEDSVEHVHAAGEELLRIASNYVLYTDLLTNPVKHRSASPLPEDWAQVLSKDVRLQAIEAGRMKDLHYSFQDAAVDFPLEQLRKIVHELLRNAFNYTEPADRVTVTGSVVGENYAIVIRDEGRGMSPEQIDAVYPVHEADPSRRPRTGSGLGLTIVQLLIERHGGSIRLASPGGAGVTVEIELPLAAS